MYQRISNSIDWLRLELYIYLYLNYVHSSEAQENLSRTGHIMAPEPFVLRSGKINRGAVGFPRAHSRSSAGTWLQTAPALADGLSRVSSVADEKYKTGLSPCLFWFPRLGPTVLLVTPDPQGKAS